MNTGDDTVLHGLHISPDLDTVTYTLAGAINPETGWGLAGETWQAMDALQRYGDVRPLARARARRGSASATATSRTHLYRTHRLAEGASLSAVTAEIAPAWGLGLRILPDERRPGRDTWSSSRARARSASRSTSSDASTASPVDGRALRRRRRRPARAGRRSTRSAAADAVVIAPSNPIVSIGPILAVPGVRDAVAARARATSSPSRPSSPARRLKGPADRMLHRARPRVVGRRRRPPLRRRRGRALVIDDADARSPTRSRPRACGAS